jgi:Flp pilus assembly protein CpaB
VAFRDISMATLASAGRGLRLRAVIGGLLVAVALLAVSQAYAEADRPPTTRFAVATRTLAPGTVLDEAVVDLVPAELPPTTAARAFTATEALRGAVTLAPLDPGELVMLSQVLPAGAGTPAGVELSFSLGPERALAGAVQPGERIDLVATFPAGATRLVAESALVTAITVTSDGLLSDAGELVLTVRLREQAELLGLVEAVDEGRLTIARQTVGPGA